MDEWFDRIVSRCALPEDLAQALADVGFAVVPGPIPAEAIARLASAYDLKVALADPVDVGTGGPSTRVHDFVNRGEEFDSLYVHEPILAACCAVIGRPFKLSTMHARTLNPHSPVQDLHADFPRGSSDRAFNKWPMVGFIYMIDEFRRENGATRFVPGSHLTDEPPNEGHVWACGPAGSMVVFNGSVWHGHGANETGQPRRSVQGAFIHREAKPWVDLPARMRPETLSRIGTLAKYLLAV